MICRFGGHCREFYSVAQHSVRVAMAVPIEVRLQALLHDASEAYLGDVVRPLKRLMPNYRGLEAKVLSVIMARFGCPTEIADSVHEMDEIALDTEFVELGLPDGIRVNTSRLLPPFEGAPEGCWTPTEAEGLFLLTFAGCLSYSQTSHAQLHRT